MWMQGVLCKIVGTLLGHALRDSNRFRRGRERKIADFALPALSPAFAWDWILDKGLLDVGSGEGMYLPHFSDISLTFHLHPKILLRRFTDLCILVVTHTMPTTTTILPLAASEHSSTKAFFLLLLNFFSVWTNNTQPPSMLAGLLPIVK